MDKFCCELTDCDSPLAKTNFRGLIFFVGIRKRSTIKFAEAPLSIISLTECFPTVVDTINEEGDPLMAFRDRGFTLMQWGDLWPYPPQRWQIKFLVLD